MFCAKESDKRLSDFDYEKCLKFLWTKLDIKDIAIEEKCKYELQYYGYIATFDNTSNKNLWIVVDSEVRGKSKNHLTTLQNLNNGEKKIVKTKNKFYIENPYEIGDILNIRAFSKEGKWIFPTDGSKPQQSCTQFEEFLNDYRKEEK
jgi:hypothetical protein